MNPTVVSSDPLEGAEVLAVLPSRDVAVGRPTLQTLVNVRDRVVVVVEFPVQASRLGSLAYRVELDAPEARATSLWPTPDASSATFGVQADLTLGPRPVALSLRYDRTPPVVAVEGRDGSGFGWVLAADGAQLLPSACHRLFAVVTLPGGTTSLQGALVVDVPDRSSGEVAHLRQRFAVPVDDRRTRALAPPEAIPISETARRDVAPAAARVVSTGLTDVARPAGTLPPDRCAEPGSDYLYWFTIGEPVPGAIDDDHVPVDLTDAPAGTVLTVALFAFPGEIEIRPGADIAELVLVSDGSVTAPGSAVPDRLLFPVRTPGRPGTYRLRCHLYRSQTLLQSRLVEIEVAHGAPPQRRAVRSTVDYVVDSALDAVALAAVSPLTLSIFANDNGDGTHGFRMLGHDGEDLVKADVVLDAGYGAHLERARKALQKVCWGTESELTVADDYRYRSGARPDLAEDLITMAIKGSMIWWEIGQRIAEARTSDPGEGDNRRRALDALTRSPGTVEFATKFSGVAVPAGLFYDYLLDPEEQLSVCATALEAIAQGRDLAPEPCFQGRCPSHADLDDEDDTVVCPGGFWGFRHAIGFPQTTRAGNPNDRLADPPSSGIAPVRYSGRPHCVVAAATDFGQDHPAAVAARGDDGSRPVITTRPALLSALRDGAAPPHVVYLFCHGTVSDSGLPALRIGPEGSALITPNNIDRRMNWHRTRPLVILNGCRTVSGRPEWPLRFVDAFVRHAEASGVVGTEITTFEPLGVAFGDLLLDGLLVRGEPVAQAARSARLRLLARGNPLGMIYVAYAAPQLRLTPAAS